VDKDFIATGEVKNTQDVWDTHHGGLIIRNAIPSYRPIKHKKENITNAALKKF